MSKRKILRDGGGGGRGTGGISRDGRGATRGKEGVAREVTEATDTTASTESGRGGGTEDPPGRNQNDSTGGKYRVGRRYT